MTFIWPSMLLGLLVVPVAIGLYVLVNRRRRSLAANFALAQPVKKPGPGFRRHIPAVLFLLGLVIVLVALARPQAKVNLPRIEGTVILLFDVSGSMGAKDVEPTRMEAAKVMAREFIQSQPETVKIGIVSFSSSGFAVQSPTNDTNSLLNAINRLEPTSGTSLGQGILAALKAIAVDAGLMSMDDPTPEAPSDAQNEGQDAQPFGGPDADLLAQLPEGVYPAAGIVILSDGEDNMSMDPLQAAQAAVEHQVRIDTLGFGTTAGITLELDGYSVHTALNEGVLQAIAQAGGGTYYPAQGQQDPQAVYASLTPKLVVKPETMELTSVFAGASILILLAGSLFSMLWFNRLL